MAVAVALSVAITVAVAVAVVVVVVVVVIVIGSQWRGGNPKSQRRGDTSRNLRAAEIWLLLRSFFVYKSFFFFFCMIMNK